VNGLEEVKKGYMRAIAKVHPDKFNASVEQRMLASSVFEREFADSLKRPTTPITLRNNNKVNILPVLPRTTKTNDVGHFKITILADSKQCRHRITSYFI